MSNTATLFTCILWMSFFTLRAQQPVNPGDWRVNITVRNASPVKVLKIIRKQVPVGTSVDPELVRNAKEISINVRNAPLKYVLDLMCKDQIFNFHFDGLLIVLDKRDSLQTDVKKTGIRIHGTIWTLNNEPLWGAKVTSRASGDSVFTTSGGEFYFENIEPDSWLIISGPKIKTDSVRVPANGSPIKKKVQDTVITLSAVEIIFTGYQQFPKRMGTNSVFSFGQESLQKRPSRDIIERLEGIVPALLPVTNKTPGTYQPTYFALGGRTTLITSSDPLIIVDNFPFQGELTDLNPDNVENVTVLRDASAAGIWGARAANGVIVITTKSAKFNRPLRVSFDWSMSRAPKPALKSDRMNSEERIWLDSFWYANKFFNTLARNPAHLVLSPVVEAFYDTTMTDANRKALFDTWRQQDNRSDMKKYFFSQTLREHISAQVSGGGNMHAFACSLGYDGTQPELRSAREERITVTAGNSLRPLPGLELSGAVSYSQNTHHNTGGLPEIPEPYEMLKGSGDSALFHPFGYRLGYIDTAGGQKLLDWKYYPLTEFALRDNTLTETNTRTQAGVRYRNFPGFLRGLEAAILMQWQMTTNTEEYRYKKETYFVRDLVNKYSKLTAAGVERPIPWEDISDLTTVNNRAGNLRYLLSYNKKWGDQTAVSFMAGRDELKVKDRSSREYTYGKKTNRLNYNAFFPMFYSPGSELTIPDYSKENTTVTSYISDYLNANVQWKGRYSLSGSARLDKSNLYGTTTNDKILPLLSAGSAWEPSAEAFYHSSVLPFLKLRATWGTSGNAPKNATALQTFRASAINRNGDPMASFDNPPLDRLRWEKVSTLNIGLNFRTAADRVEGTIDWYSKKGTDLVGFRPLDPTSGNTALTGNVASMASRNMDVILETRNICRELQWRSSLLFTYVKDYVTYTKDELKEAWMYCDPTHFSPVKGRPLYSIYSFRLAGLDTEGNPVGPGKSTRYDSMLLATGSDSLIYHGRSTPPVFGSLGNEFRWKQLSLSVTLLYKFGYYFRRASVNYYDIFYNRAPGSADFAGRWKKPGDENSIKIPSIPKILDQNRDIFYNYSQVLVERADHIRLQNINLSFDLERNALKRLGMRMASIYCNWSNIGIIWRANDHKIDPDKLSGYRQPAMLTIGFRGTFK